MTKVRFAHELEFPLENVYEKINFPLNYIPIKVSKEAADDFIHLFFSLYE
jgi:hypothetical protein